jgi:hypothetical protein
MIWIKKENYIFLMKTLLSYSYTFFLCWWKHVFYIKLFGFWIKTYHKITCEVCGSRRNIMLGEIWLLVLKGTGFHEEQDAWRMSLVAVRATFILARRVIILFYAPLHFTLVYHFLKLELSTHIGRYN